MPHRFANRAMQIRHFEQAKRHVAQGERHIAEQEERVEHLVRRGYDVTEAGSSWTVSMQARRYSFGTATKSDMSWSGKAALPAMQPSCPADPQDFRERPAVYWWPEEGAFAGG